MPSTSIHSLSFTKLNSKENISLDKFKGKKLLLVNVASNCGFTHQYKELQELYETNKEQLVVIGFPCNQFLFQESGSEEKIESFCQLNYGVTFPMSTKIKVKGLFKHPIYKWLCSKEYNNLEDYKVSWNFNKFLLDENGCLLKHFDSKFEPLEIQKWI
jgi:glutathione peroxidase